MESTNITLHTDGTSRQKKTYIGQQLTLDSGETETLSLGIRTVATEDSQTLLDLTVTHLEEIS